MTYPQLSSVKPVRDGQDFFRLKTQIVSSGDIYESEVGSNGIVLGPDSDIARVLVTYMDVDNDPTQVSQAIVSPDRNMAGLVPALNTLQYPMSIAGETNPRRGRILYSLADYFDQRFRPSGFNGVNDSIVFEQPWLDVIQYFKSLPSESPQRSDRRFVYQYVPAPLVASNSTWLFVPAYGRKSAFFSFYNLDGINTVTVSIIGVNIQPTSLGTPAGGSQKSIMAAPVALAANASTTVVWKTSDATYGGLFDMFGVKLLNYAGAAMPIQITLSDDAE